MRAGRLSQEKIAQNLILTARYATLYNRLTAKSGENMPDQSKTSLDHQLGHIFFRHCKPSDAPALLNPFRDAIRRVNSRGYNPQQIAAWASDDIDSQLWAARINQRFAIVAKRALSEGPPQLLSEARNQSDSERTPLCASTVHR